MGTLPPASTELIVPSAALVSIAIACEPLRIPSRLSKVPVPRSGLVVASPSFTMPESQVKIWRPVASSKTVLVARALRPLLLFTYSLFAIARQCSKNPGSVLSPSGADTPLAFELLGRGALRRAWSGGLFGSRPAAVNAFLL